MASVAESGLSSGRPKRGRRSDSRIDRPSTPECPGGSVARLVELDGLRGLAALAVVAYHWLYVSRAAPTGALGGALTAHLNWLFGTPLQDLVDGPQMVLLFFVLSGLVLTFPFRRGTGPSVAKYLITRAARLYPAAWAVAAIAALGALLVPETRAARFSPWIDQQFATPLASSWHFMAMLVPFDPSHLDGPLWSLEQELRASLLLPCLVMLVSRHRPAFMAAVATALILIGSAATANLATWSWTPVVIGCFVLGILLANHRDSLNRRWQQATTRVKLAVSLSILVAFWLPTGWNAPFFDRIHLETALPAFGACGLIVIAQNGTLRRWLRTGPCRWLGQISYSLYLLHVVILLFLLRTLKGHVPISLIPIGGIALSVLGAAAMQRYIEAPGIAIGRHLAKRYGGIVNSPAEETERPFVPMPRPELRPLPGPLRKPG